MPGRLRLFVVGCSGPAQSLTNGLVPLVSAGAVEAAIEPV